MIWNSTQNLTFNLKTVTSFTSLTMINLVLITKDDKLTKYFRTSKQYYDNPKISKKIEKIKKRKGQTK